MSTESTLKIPQMPDNLFGQSAQSQLKNGYARRKSLLGIRSPLEGP